MDGINRAIKKPDTLQKMKELLRESSSTTNHKVPCIFISYQRDDENYAQSVANYIMSKQIDVYFDLNDSDLRLKRQLDDPAGVTEAIKIGLNNSQYMIVIVSNNTYKSAWVPFEIGYAYDNKADNMKILRHKNIAKNNIPDYMKVKELLHGTASLNRFLDTIRKSSLVYESLIRESKVMKFDEYTSNPLNKYLDNE